MIHLNFYIQPQLGEIISIVQSAMKMKTIGETNKKPHWGDINLNDN